MYVVAYVPSTYVGSAGEPTCVGLFEYERTIESVHNGHCAPVPPLNTMKNGFQSDVPRHASLTNLRLAVVACSVRCAYRLTRQLNMPPLKTVGARRQTAARRGRRSPARESERVPVRGGAVTYSLP